MKNTKKLLKLLKKLGINPLPEKKPPNQEQIKEIKKNFRKILEKLEKDKKFLEDSKKPRCNKKSRCPHCKSNKYWIVVPGPEVECANCKKRYLM